MAGLFKKTPLQLLQKECDSLAKQAKYIILKLF